MSVFFILYKYLPWVQCSCGGYIERILYTDINIYLGYSVVVEVTLSVFFILYKYLPWVQCSCRGYIEHILYTVRLGL